jgi:hypothetical protein
MANEDRDDFVALLEITEALAATVAKMAAKTTHCEEAARTIAERANRLYRKRISTPHR